MRQTPSEDLTGLCKGTQPLGKGCRLLLLDCQRRFHTGCNVHRAVFPDADPGIVRTVRRLVGDALVIHAERRQDTVAIMQQRAGCQRQSGRCVLQIKVHSDSPAKIPGKMSLPPSFLHTYE